MKPIEFWQEKLQRAHTRIQEVGRKLRAATRKYRETARRSRLVRLRRRGHAVDPQVQRTWETKIAKLRRSYGKLRRRISYFEERITEAQTRSRYARLLKAPPI